MGVSVFPSPLEGEGARRADEGCWRIIRSEAAVGSEPLTRLALCAIHPLLQGERERAEFSA